MKRGIFIAGVTLAGLLAGHTAGAAETAPPPDTTIVIYPITSGMSHQPSPPIDHVVILGTQATAPVATAVATATDMFRHGGITVLEKSPPRSLMGSQGLYAADGAAVDPALLAFGKDAGADHLILLDVTDTLVLVESGRALAGYLHDERVTVRGIGVASGALVLEGTARWSQPVERAGQYVRQLTAYAIARALCPPEKWEEASEINKGRGRCRR